MAGTADGESTDTRHYVDYDEYVDFQLEKTREHIKRTDVFTTVTAIIAAFVGYLLVFVVCDQWLIEGGFGLWARIGLLSVVVLGLGALLVARVIVPLLRRVHPLYAARVIEHADPNLQSNLLNFVDVRGSDGPQSAPVVLRAMQKRAAVELSKIDVDEAVDRRPLLRMAYGLLAIVVASALYIIFSPKDAFVSVRRALLPTAAIGVATETTINNVTPGDDTVPARTLLTIEAEIRGPQAEAAQIVFTTGDHKYVNQPVEMRRVDADLPQFRGMLNGENGHGLLQDLTYRIVAGDARTREFRVEVVQPPSAHVDDVHLAFPSYMQLDDRTTTGGNIDGWEGAVVTVHATANMPLKSAVIVMTDGEDPLAKGEEVAMQVADGTKLSAKWKLDFRTDGTSARFYHVQVKTLKGETDPEPVVHTLRIRPDQRPEVTLLAPTGDLTGERAKAPNAIVPLLIQAVDPDFRLRSISLKGERNGEKLEDLPMFENLDQSFRGGYDWNLSAWNLRPGETIQFWVEARDNKQPTPNRGVTPRLNLEIAGEKKTTAEVRQELAAEKQQQAEQIARAENRAGERGEQPPQGDQASNLPDNNPPERPQPDPRDAQPSPKTTDAAREEETGDKQGADPRVGPQDKKSGTNSPPPPGTDHEQALKQLLQQERPDATQDQDQNQNQTEEKQRQPSGGQQGEQNDEGGNRGKSGEINSRNKSGNGEAGNNDNRSQDPGNPGGKPGDGKKQPQPGGNSSKEPDASKQPGHPREGGNKSDQNGTEGKPGQKPGGDQSTGDKSENSPSGESRPGEKTANEKPSNDGRPGDKPQPDKSTGDAGQETEGGSKGPQDKSAATREKVGTDRESGKEEQTNGGQDPSSDGASKEGDTASEEDGQGGQGAPSKPKSAGGKESPGNANNGAKSPDSKSGAGKPDSADGGAEEPAEDSPDAKKRQATGKEQGEATGSDDDDPNAPQANDVKRKADSPPGRKKPSNKSSSDSSKPGEKRPPQDGTSESTDDAQNGKRPADGKKSTRQPEEIDDPLSQRPEKSSPGQREKRPGQPPDAGNQPQQGEGRKSRQQMQQSDTGEKGNSAATDQGQPGGNKEGAGDKSDQPGGAEQSEEKTDQSGQESGPGSKSKPGEQGSQSKSGSGEKQGDGQAAGEGSSGKPSSKPGSKQSPGKSGPEAGGPPSGQSPTSDGGGVRNVPSGDNSRVGDGSADGEQGLSQTGQGGDSVPSAEEEQARLEYARKATNLLLKRLQKQLARGEVDQKLLDDMGWKDMDDVARFAKFLVDNLREQQADNSPEANARRLQFEELLKGMNLGNQTQRRQGGGSPERRVEPTGVRNDRVPPEYRQQYENYTKRLAKQRTTDNAKPGVAKPPKK